MGTDIHIYVEKKDKDGNWQYVEPTRTARYWSGGDLYRTWAKKIGGTEVYDPCNRNYNLFAFLANVRNGTGFAGIPTHQTIEPQFPRRGIPEDCSYTEPNYDDEHDNSPWLGDHSFTWATVKELVAAAWDVEFSSTGMVNSDQYKHFKEYGMPNGWCGDVSGGSVRKVSNEVMDDIIAHEDSLDHAYTRINWSWRPLAKCGFKAWVECDLVPLADGDLNSVRVVMGFDS